MNAAPPPNPYAPPAAHVAAHPAAAAGPTGVWQQDGVAVCAKGAPWPDRCVRCNAPAQGFRLKRVLYWHPGWVYLLVLVAVLVYIIVGLVMRKTATIHVGLCPQHRAKRRNWILLGWLGALASVGTCTATIDQHPGAALAGVLGVFGFAIAGMIVARVVSPKRIDDTHAWVRCGKAFVDSLPPVTGWMPHR